MREPATPSGPLVGSALVAAAVAASPESHVPLPACFVVETRGHERRSLLPGVLHLGGVAWRPEVRHDSVVDFAATDGRCPRMSSATTPDGPGGDSTGRSAAPSKGILRDRYSRELFGRNVLHLSIAYLAPLVLLAAYFHVQYRELSARTRLLHLGSVAEHRADVLDLFLRERVVNLLNLIDDPRLPLPPSAVQLEAMLQRLRRESGAFVDVGFIDDAGIQQAYRGPFPWLEKRNYHGEGWFRALAGGQERFVITDSYLGFRRRPHLTLAVRRGQGGATAVLKAALDPEQVYRQLDSSSGPEGVDVFIVNGAGLYQLVPAEIGHPLEESPLVPPREPRLGTARGRTAGRDVSYAYAWLRTAPWAVIAHEPPAATGLWSGGDRISLLGLSVALILVVVSAIVIRARNLVELQIEKELTQAQFEHAARLASVGELSAGIAHEINNPLAIISEESGLIRDLMNPELRTGTTFSDLHPHLDNIEEAVFRCRDITRKLLSFVRKTDIRVEPHDLHQLLDELVDGFWVREMAGSSIEVAKHYAEERLEVVTDGNQLKQVFLNILKNAADAIQPPGRITISTARADNEISVSIADTGRGISAEGMGKIFLPFYSTKEVGKGTGLGLSVSLGIVRSLGGRILVESLPGKGSVFTVRLPSGESSASPGASRTRGGRR
jgi:two-component system NtrC family sensor kinase